MQRSCLVRKVEENTLPTWRAKLLKDPEWTWKSWKRKRNCNRVLSTAIENEIYRKLRDEYISNELEPNDSLVVRFTAEFDIALAQYPRQLIYNMDETCWRVESFNAQGS